MKSVLSIMGEWLADFLAKPHREVQPYSAINAEQMKAMLQPGDILLVEGNTRVSSVIKYLTQSTWSHAALYIGDELGQGNDVESAPVLLEADLQQGVIAVPLAKYTRFNTRICRPINISPMDRQRVVDYAVERLGISYDLKNLLDLGRYLLPLPPIPPFMRRRMLSLGSGDPTRALCSTLIAQAYQSVRFPVLPCVQVLTEEEKKCCGHRLSEILHIRHHSLYTPRDFDLSPYFEVVKPLQVGEFDYRRLVWQDEVPQDIRSTLLDQDAIEQAG